MKRIITGLFAVAAFTFTASAQTNDNSNDQRNWNKDRQGNHQGREGMGMRGMEKLNLTDVQKQQLKSIDEDFRNRMQALNQNGNITVNDSRSQRQALMQERKNKISAILTPEQRTQFAQLSNQDGRMGQRDGNRTGQYGDDRNGQRGEGQRGGDRIEEMKSTLGLSDDQIAKIKAGSESFRERGRAIRENQSLSDDQRRQQMETLRKDREANLKSYLTAEQIAKFEQMKGNKGDWKNKDKGDGYKEKRKTSDGKEKIKVKTT
jgi:Spy/CpxP family protein refolding chaperone